MEKLIRAIEMNCPGCEWAVRGREGHYSAFLYVDWCPPLVAHGPAPIVALQNVYDTWLDIKEKQDT